MLERQSTTVPNTSKANAVGDHHGSSTTLPSTPPSARLCSASAPFDSGNRTGGGGRSPALTNSADSELEHRLRARLAVDELAVSDADDRDVAQQQPVDLDGRDARLPRSRSRAAALRSPARGSHRRTPRRRSGRPPCRPRGRRCARAPPRASRRSAAARRRRPATRRTRWRAAGAPSRSPWRPAPWRSEWRRCRRHPPSRAPGPSRRAAARRGGPARNTSSGSCPAARPPRRRRCHPGVRQMLAGGTTTRSAHPPSMASAVTRCPGLNSDS